MGRVAARRCWIMKGERGEHRDEVYAIVGQAAGQRSQRRPDRQRRASTLGARTVEDGQESAAAAERVQQQWESQWPLAEIPNPK